MTYTQEEQKYLKSCRTALNVWLPLIMGITFYIAACLSDLLGVDSACTKIDSITVNTANTCDSLLDASAALDPLVAIPLQNLRPVYTEMPSITVPLWKRVLQYLESEYLRMIVSIVVIFISALLGTLLSAAESSTLWFYNNVMSTYDCCSVIPK